MMRSNTGCAEMILSRIMLFILCINGSSSALDNGRSHPYYMLRGSANHSVRNALIDNNVAALRQRKSDLFRPFTTGSNDYDDDVINMYASSNDALTDSSASGLTSTEIGLGRAPPRPTIWNESLTTTPNPLSSTPIPSVEPTITSSPTAATPFLQAASTHSAIPTTLIPSHSPSIFFSASPSIAPSKVTTPAPSVAPNGINVIIPRYHQEEIAPTYSESPNDQAPLSSQQQFVKPNRKEHLVPALLTGFASTVLFCAIFLMCANQRERYLQKKWRRDQARRAALTDDESSAKSIARAYSDPSDVFDEEDGKSTSNSNAASDIYGSARGGSYWVSAVVKELAEKNTNDTIENERSPPNILPPLGDDEMDDASIALSLVSSLTQSIMTAGSSFWPAPTHGEVNLGPSQQRVAARAVPKDDSTEMAELRPSGSNEETNTSVCSSLTDGTSTSHKSSPDLDEISSINEIASMPAIGETEEEEGSLEVDGRRSIFSSVRSSRGGNKDAANDSITHTEPSTVDLSSEMERLQTLITNIRPGEDVLVYTDDIIPKSLSDESLDLGFSEGQEEI